jgi:hypothetical protein
VSSTKKIKIYCCFGLEKSGCYKLHHQQKQRRNRNKTEKRRKNRREGRNKGQGKHRKKNHQPPSAP